MFSFKTDCLIFSQIMRRIEIYRICDFLGEAPIVMVSIYKNIRRNHTMNHVKSGAEAGS